MGREIFDRKGPRKVWGAMILAALLILLPGAVLSGCSSVKAELPGGALKEWTGWLTGGDAGEDRQAGKIGQTGENGQSGETGQVGKAGQSGETGQSGKAGQAAEAGRAEGRAAAAGSQAAGGKEGEARQQEEADRKGGTTGEVFTWNRHFPKGVRLPKAYDYREEGRAPQIGNQGSLGTCWAFASLTALSSSLLPGETAVFSVDHMSMHNNFLLAQDEGGEYTMSMAYLLGWQGPVWESEDPYGDGISPDGLKPRKHVQEIQILPPKDYEAIKEAVYLVGGVQSSLYTSMKDYQSESVYYNRETNSYCYVGSEKPNHDSVIVGWDDGYPKENFNMELEGDGAFICTNSWGEDFGEQGYFYVSYYDTNIGVNNIVYTEVDPVDNYSRMYQSDLCGWIGQIGYGEDEAWFANAFQTEKEERLMAAGFYATDRDTEYEIYVARHLPKSGGDSAEKALKSRILAAKGTLQYAGYYTVPLGEKILLEDGEKFAIIVKIMTPGTVHPVAIEYDAGDGIAQVDLTDGEGYLSYDGSIWENVEKTQNCNVCLKAYTRDKDG